MVLIVISELYLRIVLFLSKSIHLNLLVALFNFIKIELFPSFIELLLHLFEKLINETLSKDLIKVRSIFGWYLGVSLFGAVWRTCRTILRPCLKDDIFLKDITNVFHVLSKEMLV